MTEGLFGRTWWGNSWVETLEKSNYSKELLEEGKNYVLKGNIKKIELNNGDIFAVVQGTDEIPCEINIKLDKFTTEEQKIISDILASNPAIATELSLGELPSRLKELINALNIELMPVKWQNMNSSCSCENSEKICKHTASVYLFLANEIDKNPFLIFELKGMNINSMMNSSGMILHPEIAYYKNSLISFSPYEQIEITNHAKPVNEIDLTFTDLKIKSIFKLLPDNPLFIKDENFKIILIEKYKSLASFVSTFSLDYTKVNLKRTQFFLVYGRNGANNNGKAPVFQSHFLFSHEYYIKQIKPKQEYITTDIPVIRNNSIVLENRKMKDAEIDDVLNFFLSLPLNSNPDEISPSAAFLNMAAAIALSLVKSYSFIPELVGTKEEFFIRYIPLIHDKKIECAIEMLKSITPRNFIFRINDKSIFNGEIHTFILSLFITHIVHLHNKKTGRNYYFSEQKIYNTFFRGDVYKQEKFEEETTAKNITDWLERISIHKRTVRPVIIIGNTNHEKFLVTVEVESKSNGKQSVPLSYIFKEEQNFFGYDTDILRTEIARELKIASEYFSPLSTLLNGKGENPVIINSLEMSEFISTTLDTIRLLGIKVILPEKLKNLSSPKVIITARSKNPDASISYFSLSDILQFDWQVAIGDKIISAEEFLKLAETARGIVSLGDTYFILDPDELKNIIGNLKTKKENISSKEILQTILTGEFKGINFQPDDLIKDKLENLLKPEDISLPSNLKADLRPYQERGYKWLYSNVSKGLGSCLADDMGLGKTIQVISLLLKLKEEGNLNSPALVVCPTTLVGNWVKECKKFAPSLKVYIYHGTNRKLLIKNNDLIITTYGTIRNDLRKFEDKQWSVTIIDEAQNIKNPDAEQTKSVKLLKSEKFIAMTGTPVENRLAELWSIFDFVNEGYLGSLGNFKRNYALPIEKYRDKEKIDRLRKITSPFLMRRLKTDPDIIKDLPEKFILDEYCYLSKEQSALYDEIVKSTLEEIRQNSGIQRKGMIFRLITSLKQICNHPAHYTKESIYRKELSGKTEKLFELLEHILDRNEKVIIFSQYKEMGDILFEIIRNEMNIEPAFFHGSLNRELRDQIVQNFQELPDKRIMLVSLKAGGTGLNLTAAVNVIHYDLWWNPAVENQATDRTFRIGQDKNVNVHRLITLGTFEEKIDEMLNLKRELADLTVSEGESWISELSDKELKELFVYKK